MQQSIMTVEATAVNFTDKKTMYRVMNTIYESNLPINFEEARGLKVCLHEVDLSRQYVTPLILNIAVTYTDNFG